MKKILTSAILIMAATLCRAQEPPQLQLEQVPVVKNYVYCELVGSPKAFSQKINVIVDFGQETSFWGGDWQKVLRDENGKAITFNSMIDAMNWFGAQGWEFVQAYVVMLGDTAERHWILKKEIPK